MSTPVKIVKIISCQTCGKELENAKDRYKLFGSQELYKTLENILELAVELEQSECYICSSCRARLIKYSKMESEAVEIKKFFKDSKKSDVLPVMVRFKRGRKTPPNPAQVTREPRLVSKAQRSIDFTNQQTASSISHNVSTSSASSIPETLLNNSSRPVFTDFIGMDSERISTSPSSNGRITDMNNKSTQTSTKSNLKHDLESNINQERIVVSCMLLYMYFIIKIYAT